MTKAEAIRILEQSCPKRPQKLWSIERKEAVKMAIEALEVGHAQCNDCHYRYHWMTQRMNGQNGGATA